MTTKQLVREFILSRAASPVRLPIPSQAEMKLLFAKVQND